MAYQAANAIPLTGAFQSPAVVKWTGPPDKLPSKIDVFVSGTDAVLQVSEDQSGAFIDDQSQEILLRAGFHSRVFVTPFTAWRFKIWSGTALSKTSGSVDYTVYA